MVYRNLFVNDDDASVLQCCCFCEGTGDGFEGIQPRLHAMRGPSVEALAVTFPDWDV